MPKKTYAILGSNCFSASDLVDLLLEAKPDIKIVGISRSTEKKQRDHKNFAFHQADLVQETNNLWNILDETKPEVVINYAALSEVFLSNESPVEYFDINTRAVVDLVQRLRKRNYLKHYIHISSAEIYGDCKKPVDETAPLRPTSAYAASKAAADLYLQTALERTGFPVSMVRSTNVYGKFQQLFKIIPRTIIHLREGKKIALHGGGRVVRPFIHIRDVSNGVLKIIAKEKIGEIYHFSTENRRSIAEVVEFICEKMNCNFTKMTKQVDGRSNQDRAYLLDYSKAKRELDWSPEINFKQGIQAVIEWIEKNWDLLKNEPMHYMHKI